MRKILTATVGIAAALAVATGCSDDSTPASTSSSAPATSTQSSAPSSVVPTSAAPTAPAPPRTGTVAPTPHPATTKPQGPDNGGTYNVPCTGGPDEGTICTNPNHGAGDNPTENGTAPTSTPPRTSTKVRDDDPGGKPCTTGMGVPGTYVYSESSGTWVCQIS
ncbi:hypothetical protein [Tsukamurella sp. PLM1]|uniref:hypothetical protein n=1 Tax=Tsukamurella sp. PLM1 TaxID=2929795 RepID=UPI00204A6F12|nr:hypothetical protein [Tsukamurella sp. PLM1]BDH55817.1 hypothetical protein MTP03_07560 [Tsukamurella sp. PLM1]